MEEIKTMIFSTLKEIIFEGENIGDKMKGLILEYSPLESYITMIGDLSDDIYIITRTQETNLSNNMIDLLDKLYYLYNIYRIELWYHRKDFNKCEKVIIDHDSLLSPVYEELRDVYKIEIEGQDINDVFKEYV